MDLDHTDGFFSYKIFSITLSIALISISCVLTTPIFPNRRSSNLLSGIFGNVIYVIADSLLLIELWTAGILQDVPNNVLTSIKGWCTKFRRNNGREKYKVQPLRNRPNEQTDTVEPSSKLAWFFFSGYLVLNSWRILNELHFIFVLGECFNHFEFFADLCKMLLGLLILVSVAFKTRLTFQRKLSYYTWSIAGATCFSVAFSYIVEEVIWAYVDIVENSIEVRHYGLDILPNITTVEQYIELIFKLKANCVQHSLGADSVIVKYIIELMPFSAEYFAFATFFCFVVWSNLEPDNQELAEIQQIVSATHGPPRRRHSEPNMAKKTTPAMTATTLEPNRNPSLTLNYETITQVRSSLQVHFERINVVLKCLAILILLSSTIGFTVAVLVSFSYDNDILGIWLFHGQRIFLQAIGGCSQFGLYWFHFRKMTPKRSPPSKFQLDIIFLIFPLIPLAIIFTLRACPDIMNLTPAYYTSLRWLQIIWDIFLAIVSWLLFAYQALFITQILRRLHCNNISKFKPWFRGLFFINFCIWISWTIECKAVTLNSGASHMFGVVQWTILVYATVPFVLFGFAHSAACFWEIAHHIGS